MTTEEVLKHIFLYGSFHETHGRINEETHASLLKLIEKKFIKEENHGIGRTVWVENREVTDKILYPNKDKPICGSCRRQGEMSTFSPCCGPFCGSACWVEHTRRCRSCAISLAMED